MSDEYITIDAIVADYPVTKGWNTALTASVVYQAIGEGVLQAFERSGLGRGLVWDDWSVDAAHGQLLVREVEVRQIVEATIADRLK